jgi:acyl-CoA thioester hydrolase
MNYFNKVLEEQMDWEVEGLILASITINYLTPIFLNDNVVVRSKIYQIGNKSLKMSQDIFDKSTGQVSATSESTMVCFSNKQQVTLTVPKRWRDKIAAFEKDILFEV